MGARSRDRQRVFRGRRSLGARLFRKPTREQAVVYDEIPVRATTRKCQHQDKNRGCRKDATRVRFNVSAGGRIDRSSKTFRCDEHN